MSKHKRMPQRDWWWLRFWPFCIWYSNDLIF